mgnify:CR=1 FL=1|jgi:hypothetical protein
MSMAIYINGNNAETEEKKPEQSELVQASEQKTYTQEEVLAMLAQVQNQKREEKE